MKSLNFSFGCLDPGPGPDPISMKVQQPKHSIQGTAPRKTPDFRFGCPWPSAGLTSM